MSIAFRRPWCVSGWVRWAGACGVCTSQRQRVGAGGGENSCKELAAAPLPGRGGSWVCQHLPVFWSGRPGSSEATTCGCRGSVPVTGLCCWGLSLTGSTATFPREQSFVRPESENSSPSDQVFAFSLQPVPGFLPYKWLFRGKSSILRGADGCHGFPLRGTFARLRSCSEPCAPSSPPRCHAGDSGCCSSASSLSPNTSLLGQH